MKDEDILKEARERYKSAHDGWDHIYKEAKDDLRMVYDIGDGQWPAEVRKARGNRPIVTVNKLQKFVRQRRGDQMQNRPRMKVIPVDSVADPKKAKLFNGLIRKIEYLSDANIAYDTAYGGALASSIGFFRLITQFEDDNSVNQEIRIKRVTNPFSILFDPMAQEFNLEDAQYCFVEDLMKVEDFKRKYPKATHVDFEGESSVFGDWLDGDNIRIAEYYAKEPIEKKIALLDTGETVELDEITLAQMERSGARIVKERTVKTHKVVWYKINGAEILERTDWPGKYIPIIPVFGDEVILDGKKYYISMARGAKGPQQMYNVWASAATENVMMSPKAPYMVDHRQIEGFEKEWDESNVKNRMYIRYKSIGALGKPSREPQTQVPAAIIGMLQSTAYDIEDSLGMYEASKGQASNERSGKAIKARLEQSDKGTFAFVDNFIRAIVYSGKQIIDLIPKIYDTARAVQIIGETGEDEVANINTPVMGPNGEIIVDNDLSVGKFDIISTIGASSSSQREEMVQMMIESMQYAPTVAPYIAPLIFKFADWEGSDEVYQEIQKGVQMAQQQDQLGQGGMPPEMPVQ